MPVVHCKRNSHDVYIGRPTRWGNPFVIGRHGTREEVIEKYRHWVMNSDESDAIWIRAHLGELKGKTLGCWCAPDACHGDVLLELAEEA